MSACQQISPMPGRSGDSACCDQGGVNPHSLGIPLRPHTLGKPNAEAHRLRPIWCKSR